MGKLSTHVLNTTAGKPAVGMTIKLHQQQNGEFVLLNTTQTNNDGRCDAPLLQGDELTTGAYELQFDVAGYFAKQGVDTPFLKEVVIRFYIANAAENYHVPLLISPFSYSTYRGS